MGGAYDRDCSSRVVTGATGGTAGSFLCFDLPLMQGSLGTSAAVLVHNVSPDLAQPGEETLYLEASFNGELLLCP